MSPTSINTNAILSPEFPSYRPSKARVLPARYHDYTGLPSCFPPSVNTVNQSAPHPISNVHSYNDVSPSYFSYLCNISHHSAPTSYKQAILDPKWCEVMAQELNAPEQNKTWTLQPLPKGKKAVGCIWLFKVKYQADGSLDKYKARLVAQGHTQTQGLDYFETFAPEAKMTTVRIVTALAANHSWQLTQMDVTNAFLHGDLTEDGYMQIPQGLVLPSNASSSSSPLVCKLQKSLYG